MLTMPTNKCQYYTSNTKMHQRQKKLQRCNTYMSTNQLVSMFPQNMMCNTMLQRMRRFQQSNPDILTTQLARILLVYTVSKTSILLHWSTCHYYKLSRLYLHHLKMFQQDNCIDLLLRC